MSENLIMNLQIFGILISAFAFLGAFMLSVVAWPIMYFRRAVLAQGAVPFNIGVVLLCLGVSAWFFTLTLGPVRFETLIGFNWFLCLGIATAAIVGGGCIASHFGEEARDNWLEEPFVM